MDRLRESLRRIGVRNWLVAGGASVALLGLLIWWTGPDRLLEALGSARPGPLLVAIGIYLLVLAVRWLRLGGLLRKPGDGLLRMELLWTVTGHGLATHLLPARTGELAFPELLSRATGRSRAVGLVVLTAIRLVELGVLIPLFALGFYVWSTGPAQISANYLWGAALLAAAGVALLPAILVRCVAFASWTIERTPLAEADWFAPVRDALPQAREAADELGWRRLAWLAATTAAMWVAIFGVYHAALVACGAGPGLAQTVVGGAGGIVGNLLPVGGIGSFGPMEAGWTAAFRATGAPTGPVLAAALLVHAIVVGVTAVTAATAAALETSR